MSDSNATMTPSQIRRALLDDHARLRTIMADTCPEGLRSDPGASLPHDLRQRLHLLASELLAHNRREEATS